MRYATLTKLTNDQTAPAWEKYLSSLTAELRARGITIINPETGEPHEEQSRHE